MSQEKSGWDREIIEPFEALIAPRTLVWKEKYGTLRPEWLRLPNGRTEMVGDYGRVLEEASKLCCMACGRWHGWISDNRGEAVVETAWTNGWVKTLCAQCREADGKDKP